MTTTTKSDAKARERVKAFLAEWELAGPNSATLSCIREYSTQGMKKGDCQVMINDMVRRGEIVAYPISPEQGRGIPSTAYQLPKVKRKLP